MFFLFYFLFFSAGQPCQRSSSLMAGCLWWTQLQIPVHHVHLINSSCELRSDCHFSWATTSAIWLCLVPICHSPSFFLSFPLISCVSLSIFFFFYSSVTLLSITGVRLTGWLNQCGLSGRLGGRRAGCQCCKFPGRLPGNKIGESDCINSAPLSPNVDATPVFPLNQRAVSPFFSPIKTK